MSTPKRIQLRRTKGWRKPEGAIVVARPSRWGNEFKVWRDGSSQWWCAEVLIESDGRQRMEVEGYLTPAEARAIVAVSYRRLILSGSGMWDAPSVEDIRRELAGHDLACWCPLDQPCHADVLLEIANEGAP
jgi:hypothetical protein